MSTVQDRSIPDEEDPLGLGALLARLGEPPALTTDVEDDCSHATTSVNGQRDEDPVNAEFALDLHAVADMARQVEEARFAAETRLYAELQAAADSAAAAERNPNLGTDFTAEYGAAGAVPVDPDVPSPTPAIPAAESEPSLTDWHQELAAVVAASAAQLAAAGTPPPAPIDPGTIPVDPIPSPPQPAPVRNINASHTDTAALLRELASLGGDDRAGDGSPSAPPKAQSGVRHQPPGANAKNKRKGIFGR